MLRKILKIISKHKITTGIIILLIVAGGYFGYKTFNSSGGETQYALAAVEKGTLIVSVSGSGQVIVLQELDIKPKISGDITAFYIKKDQEVKTGQLLAELDSNDAQKAIRDAQVALDSAKAKLEDLLSQPNANSLLQAKNSLAQAGRDLEKVKENYQVIETDAKRSLMTAYDDGYSSVSTTFFKLSDYMKDLKDVLGTDKSSDEYIGFYEIVIGSGSLFIQRVLDDYHKANDLFNENFAFFRTVFRDDNRDTVYQLIDNTIKTSKAVSQALESARHMYDAIVVQDYKHLTASSYIEQMQSKIESDVSSAYSIVSSLQRIKDTIDDTNKNTPKKIEDAQLAIQSAQEKLDEKKLALEELMAGADPQDIDSQRNTLVQKEDALSDAKEKLANCYIYVPFDGIVVEIKAKKGDSVSTGTVLASIVTKQKIAKITLNEIDAAKVKVGQKTTLTFDALPEISIAGRVIEVDTVGQVSQGVVSYGVKIAFDPVRGKASNGVDTDVEQVKPGMSVAVDIITEAKLDVLVLPSSAIKSQGNSYYVELVDPVRSFTSNGVEMTEEMRQQLLANVSGTILPNPPKSQPVEIGLSNDFSTEIISGLKEGDIVVSSVINPNQNQAAQTQNTQKFQIPGMGGQRMFTR